MRAPITFFCLLLLAASLPAAPTNIMVILADDLGWLDLRCQGNDQLDTPHLDRLAGQGMRFTDAYAASPVCTPTRASMMTDDGPVPGPPAHHQPRGGPPRRLRAEAPRPAPARPGPGTSRWSTKPSPNACTRRGTPPASWASGTSRTTAARTRTAASSRACARSTKVSNSTSAAATYGGPPSFFEPYRIPANRTAQGGRLPAGALGRRVHRLPAGLARATAVPVLVGLLRPLPHRGAGGAHREIQEARRSRASRLRGYDRGLRHRGRPCPGRTGSTGPQPTAPWCSSPPTTVRSSAIRRCAPARAISTRRASACPSSSAGRASSPPAPPCDVPVVSTPTPCPPSSPPPGCACGQDRCSTART